MKIKSIAIMIILTTAIFMSCSSNKTKTADENASNEVANNHRPEVITDTKDDESEETHELNNYGAGPHQGIVKEAGENNHLEMVVSGADVIFYPLDGKTEPLDSKNWKGNAVFQYKDGATKTIDLMIMNGNLAAMGANSGKSFNAIATMMNNGETISAQFNSDEAK